MRLERGVRAIALTASIAVLAACGANQGGVKNEGAATKREEAARVHTDLGQQYLRQGRLELALEKLDKALSYDSGYADAHTVIAVLYEHIGDTAKAEEHYRRAAQLRPKGGAELNNYGTFLCKGGRYAEANGYFERAIADPFYQTPATALTNAGTCLLKAGKRDEAEKLLRQALERQPNDAEALLQLAAVAYGKGEYMNARAFIQRHEAQTEPRPEALLLGRNIELHLGNGRGAGDYTRKLLQGFPESQEARSLNAQSRDG